MAKRASSIPIRRDSAREIGIKAVDAAMQDKGRFSSRQIKIKKTAQKEHTNEHGSGGQSGPRNA
jgi:hypothetical protein